MPVPSLNSCSLGLSGTGVSFISVTELSIGLAAGSDIPAGVTAEQHQERLGKKEKVVFKKNDLGTLTGLDFVSIKPGYAEIMFSVICDHEVEIIMPASVVEHFRIKNGGRFAYLFFHVRFLGKVGPIF